LSNWSDKQLRAYRRILYGVKKHKNERLRFLTLGSPEIELKCDMKEAFRLLYHRIRRLTPRMLLKEGYLELNQCVYYYGKKNIDKTFSFEYLRIDTGEGPNGVFHILFYGQFIPQKWLYDSWKEILGVDYLANQSVDIKQCKKKTFNSKRLAVYCISQYAAGQSKYERFSCSQNWVFKGFSNVVNRLRKTYSYGEAFDIAWSHFLSTIDEKEPFQVVLKRYFDDM